MDEIGQSLPVESMIVPSKSVNTPSTSIICGGAEKLAETSEDVMIRYAADCFLDCSISSMNSRRRQ